MANQRSLQTEQNMFFGKMVRLQSFDPVFVVCLTLSGHGAPLTLLRQGERAVGVEHRA